MKRLAVIKVATSVMQSELLSLTQAHEEPVRQFAARAQGIARSCNFEMKCTSATCTATVDFSDHIVKAVVVSSIADPDIKREVLGVEKLDEQTLNDTITVIEAKEVASRSMKCVTDVQNAANSSFKNKQSEDAKLKIQVKCESCQKSFSKNKKRKRWKN